MKFTFYLNVFVLFSLVVLEFTLSSCASSTTKAVGEPAQTQETTTTKEIPKTQKTYFYRLFCQGEDKLCTALFTQVNRHRKVPVGRVDNLRLSDFQLYIVPSKYGTVLRLYQKEKLIQTGSTRSLEEVVPLGAMMVNDFIPFEAGHRRLQDF